MDKLLIRGGRPLHGEVRISGAKNAALPELCAALLTPEPVILQNIPRLQDVATMLKLIRNMGARADFEGGTVTIDSGELHFPEAPYEMVKTMRASVLALGPLLARFGEATVSLPGGCAIGARPVDQHIKGLQKMGAEIVIEHGYMIAKLPKGRTRLQGANIRTDMVTVTGTENFMMAATLAEGETILENPAQEPEITDLGEMLIAMGAKIQGHGTGRIRIEGVEKLHGATHKVVADRIECGTFLCAVAATGGDVQWQHMQPARVLAGEQVQGRGPAGMAAGGDDALATGEQLADELQAEAAVGPGDQAVARFHGFAPARGVLWPSVMAVAGG